MRNRLAGALALVVVLFAVSGLAQDEPGANAGFVPLSLQDFNMDTKFVFKLPLMIADGGTGLYPILGFTYGLGNMSAGVTLPLAVLMPDQGDSQFALGNPTLDFKIRFCSGDNMCLNVGAQVGLGVFDFTDMMKLMTVVTGLFATQEYAYFTPETFVARPIVALTILQGIIKAQAEIGLPILVPIHSEADTEMALGYGFEAGIDLMNGLLVPVVAFKGITPLTAEDADSPFWINLGARLQIGGMAPFALLSIPLNEAAGSQLDSTVFIQFGLGFAI